MTEKEKQKKYILIKIASVCLCVVPAVVTLAIFGGAFYQDTGTKLSIIGVIAVVIAAGVCKDKLLEFVGKPSFVAFPIVLLVVCLLYDWLGTFMTAMKYTSLVMLVCVVLDRIFLYPRYRRLYRELHPIMTKEVGAR